MIVLVLDLFYWDLHGIKHMSNYRLSVSLHVFMKTRSLDLEERRHRCFITEGVKTKAYRYVYVYRKIYTHIYIYICIYLSVCIYKYEISVWVHEALYFSKYKYKCKLSSFVHCKGLETTTNQITMISLCERLQSW